MKNKLIIVFVMFIGLFSPIFASDSQQNTFAADNNTQNATQTVTLEQVTNKNSLENVTSAQYAKLLEKFGNKLDEYINVVAEKMGVGVEYVWPLFVKQQVINSIVWIIGILFGYIVCGGFFFMARKCKEKSSFDCHGNPENSETVFRIIGFVGGCLTFIISSWVFLDRLSVIVTGFANPEYGAIKQIVEMATQLIK